MKLVSELSITSSSSSSSSLFIFLFLKNLCSLFGFFQKADNPLDVSTRVTMKQMNAVVDWHIQDQIERRRKKKDAIWRRRKKTAGDMTSGTLSIRLDDRWGVPRRFFSPLSDMVCVCFDS
jgi:hypothetical protein